MSGAGPGLFIAVEGGDGAGKTTQIRSLVEHLAQHHPAREVVVTREPGGTELGVSIRRLLLHGDQVAPRAEALLFAADRAHHVASHVRPALERGAVVVTDRYVDSSIAYQGAGRALDAADVASISQWATEGLVPDLTVLLDVDPETGRTRRGAEHDRLESEPDAFHTRVRAHFMALSQAAPERYLVLDASRPAHELATEVATRVEALLEEQVPRG